MTVPLHAVSADVFVSTVDVSHVFSTAAGGLGGRAVRLAALVDPVFLSEVGWDPAASVLSPPSAHPLLGRPVCCRQDCSTTAPARSRICASCLVLNAIILWNTRYLDHALASLTVAGEPIEPDEIRRLSPFQSRHINLVGRYSFIHTVLTGLRAMRSPTPSRTSSRKP